MNDAFLDSATAQRTGESLTHSTRTQFINIYNNNNNM